MHQHICIQVVLAIVGNILDIQPVLLYLTLDMENKTLTIVGYVVVVGLHLTVQADKVQHQTIVVDVVDKVVQAVRD